MIKVFDESVDDLFGFCFLLKDQGKTIYEIMPQNHWHKLFIYY